jgi:hypothetical protein
MKLVETDIPRAEDEADEPRPTPPRPERRRVAVSLALTMSVLVGTVVAVFTLFPERHNELLTVALRVYRDPDRAAAVLARPSESELRAFGLGLFGRAVPWPRGAPPAEILSAGQLRILERTAAAVRYRVNGAEVVLLAQRPREAVSRREQRRERELLAVSFRRHHWRFVAVGPVDSAALWTRVLGVP